MMRKFTRLPFLATLILAIAMVIVTQPALAYDRNDARDCEQDTDLDRKVLACTRILESGNLTNKTRAGTYLLRGGAYIGKDDFDRAIADFNEAIRIDPRSPLGYGNRGMAYYHKGDHDRAIADLNEVIRINPKSSDAYTGRGAVYSKRGDYDRAIAEFSDAIRIDLKSADAHGGRGWAYVSKGDYDHAIADFNEVTRIDPKFADIYAVRGYAYSRRGDYDHAIADFNEAIRINPNKYADAYSNRGTIYVIKGDYDRALADCNEAIRINPKSAAAHTTRGDAYSAKGEYDRAIASYSEGIRLDPLDPEPFVGRGRAYEKIAEIAKARADFNAAINILPKSEADKLEQNKARDRLAVLADVPASAAPVVAAAPSTTTAVVVSAAPIAVGDHRIALVIGNSAYENVPALPNPERDASLVAEVLKRTGFESVTVQTNLRKDALITSLRNFAARAESADWAVVYYAGHGMEVGGINYLVPTDARIAADRDIAFEAVPLEQVLNAAERARKLRLVILDACRDNPFASQMKRTLTVASRSVTRGLAVVEPEAGTLVVYAAKDGETAIDGDGNNSPFALAFAKNVQRPGLEVRRVFDNVRDDVMDATGRKQKPFSYGSISGRQDFYFVAGK